MNKSFLFRWSWLALTFILLVLAAITWVSLRNIFNADLAVTRKSDEQQIQLIASILTSEMDSGRYQNIDQMFNKLAQANDRIVSLRLDAANGFNLASYQRPAGGNHIFEINSHIAYSYHGEATFSARMDLDGVYQRNKELGIKISEMFVVFSALLSFLLYMAIRLQKEARRTRHLSNLYKALSEINQAIVRIDRQADLFPLVCRCAVDFGGMNMAWVGLLDEATGMILPAASHGNGTEILGNTVISSSAGGPEGHGPVSTALRENRPVIVNDYSNGQRALLQGKNDAELLCKSTAAFPISRGGRPFAVVQVYNLHDEGFDEEGIALLDEMSRDVSFALDNFDREKERIEAEKSMQLAASVFAASNEAIIITDANAKILTVNQAFQDITGYRQGEVVGQNPRMLQSGQHDKGFYQNMWAILCDTGKWSGEIWDKRKNGEIYPKEMTITAVYDGQHQVTHYVGVFIDNTERHNTLEQLHTTASELTQANAQVEQERAQLAERVEERTKQLQYANNAKDSFLATMSHEIRTPLGGLMGMMELLSLSQLDDKQREMLEAARSSGKSLLRIVNDILDWSKIEAGKLELAPQVASIHETLKSVAKTYLQLTAEKDIQLKIKIDPDLSTPHIFDPLRLSQILNNFTSNAVKFTERGTIEISAQRIDMQTCSEQVRFSVKDTGIGIDQTHQSRLFQHYEQANAETARMYGGTGLGLAISSRLAELMGGTLSVESTLGVGSTFSFTVSLPVASLTAKRNLQMISVATQAQETEPSISPLAAEGQHIAILIVDDHPLNRMLLKQQLDLLGLQVEAAESGTPALTLWQSGHFDLIITDCHMPEMDGYELTRRIREIERHTGAKRIPIIAWTANVLAEEEVRCREAGMDDILTKPTELVNLRTMLLQWLVKAGVLA